MFKLSNKQYDILKDIAQLGLPAVGALYVALAGIWGWPCAEQVAGTVAAIDTFLGVWLKIAKSIYDKKVGAAKCGNKDCWHEKCPFSKEEQENLCISYVEKEGE